jgi:multidrug resistance protein, MATE family
LLESHAIDRAASRTHGSVAQSAGMPCLHSATKRELRALISLALPIMLSCMLGFLMNVVDLLFVGHLGTDQLAAAALGNALWATIALPLQGCASALDTFLSQSYGAKQFAAYGQWVQTATICMTLLSLPVAVFLGLAEPMLLGIGQEPHVAASAGVFCTRLIPGVPPFIAFLCLSKCLQSQNVLAPAVYIALLSNMINCGANWLLIHSLGLGLAGAPLATSFSRWVQLLLLIGYLHLARNRLGATLPGLRVDWQQLPARSARFFRLGAPGALMLALEAWSFDLSTVMAGYLGEISLDAHTIMLNIIAFTFVSLPLALGIASAIRVGQSLGAGDGTTAKLIAKLTVAVVLALMTSLALVKLILRDSLGYLFTSDAAVVAQVASLVPIAALFQISDGLQAAIAGVMRGMGRQHLVAGLNFIGFWLIGIPVGACLTFVARIGVSGLWWGLFAGLTSVAAIGVIALMQTDWERMARSALARVNTQKSKEAPATQGVTAITSTIDMEEVVSATLPTENVTGDDHMRLPHTVT